MRGQRQLYIPGGGAAGAGSVNISAGTTSNDLTNLVFATSPTVTFGLNGSTITASAVGGAGGSVNFSAGTTSGNLASVKFADSNGVSFGLNAGTITATVKTDYQTAGAYLTTAMLSDAVTLSNVRVSGGTTSNLLSAITFADSNGVSFGLNAGTMTATVKTDYLTSQSNQALSGSNGSFAFQTATFGNLNGFSFYTSNGSMVGSYTVPTQSVQPVALSGSNGSFNFSTATFGNLNGMSFYSTNGSMVGSYTVPTVTNSVWTVSDAATSGTVARLAFTNLNGITLSLSSGAAGSHTIVGSHNALTNVRLSAGTTSNLASAFTFADAGGVSFGLNAGTITAAAPAGAPSPVNFSAGTTSGNLGSVIFANSNGVSFGLNNGASSQSMTATVKTAYMGLGTANTNVTWTANSDGLSFNAAGYAGTTTGFTGTNISASMTHNTLGLALQLNVAAGGGVTMQGGYTNLPWWTGTVSLGYIQSTSHVVPFFLQGNLSFDYVRMMQVGAIIAASTTAATAANTTFSCGYTKTYNLAIFSRGSGASSATLQLVKSTGFTEQFSNNIGLSNSSSAGQLYSNRWTLPCSSGALGFTYDYSSTQASINVNTVGAATGITGTKWIDIPFGTSLTPGQYWLMYGASTTTAVQAAGTTIGLRNYVTANPVFASQAAISFGTFGEATSNIYAPQQGLGSFTTVGGATTDSLHWSKVTISAANPQLFFALMRSA